MNQATRFRHTVARAFAAAIAFALLTVAAEAGMLRNATSFSVSVSFYNQSDTAVLVPCAAFEAPANSNIALGGVLGNCAAEIKVKAIVMRSPVVAGSTCWGERLGKNGDAAVSGNDNACAVVITN